MVSVTAAGDFVSMVRGICDGAIIAMDKEQTSEMGMLANAMTMMAVDMTTELVSPVDYSNASNSG